MPRRPESGQAFSPDEWEAIREAASHTTIFLGRGWKAKPDPAFALQLVTFLGRTGIHPSKIGALTTYNLQDDMLVWRRPKTDKKVSLPLHHELLPWIREFVSKPKPKSRWAYTAMLAKVERKVLEEEGVAIAANPLRFRHFAAKTLLEMGVPAPLVANCLRVSNEVLQLYGDQGTEHLKETLRAAGW